MSGKKKRGEDNELFFNNEGGVKDRYKSTRLQSMRNKASSHPRKLVLSAFFLLSLDALALWFMYNGICPQNDASSTTDTPTFWPSSTTSSSTVIHSEESACLLEEVLVIGGFATAQIPAFTLLFFLFMALEKGMDKAADKAGCCEPKAQNETQYSRLENF